MAAPTETGSTDCIEPPGLKKSLKDKTSQRPLCHQSACEPHRAWIENQALNLERNRMAIYQDLVEKFGFSHSYDSVKKFVRKLKKSTPKRYDRLDFPPGEEAQVDYGQGALTQCRFLKKNLLKLLDKSTRIRLVLFYTQPSTKE